MSKTISLVYELSSWYRTYSATCLEGTHWKSVDDFSQILRSEFCSSLWPIIAAISVHCWEAACFYFSRAGENSIWIPQFTKLNENTEPLKIKIDSFGNHKGNVTYSQSLQLLVSPAVGTYTVIPISYKLGRTLCPFGIVIARISVWGGRKESLHSTKESSSWIPRSQSFNVNILPKERDAPI